MNRITVLTILTDVLQMIRAGREREGIAIVEELAAHLKDEEETARNSGGWKQ